MTKKGRIELRIKPWLIAVGVAVGCTELLIGRAVKIPSWIVRRGTEVIAA